MSRKTVPGIFVMHLVYLVGAFGFVGCLRCSTQTLPGGYVLVVVERIWQCSPER